MTSNRVSSVRRDRGRSRGRGRRLLMIEDDRSIAQMYAFRLEQDGWAVEIATDGEAGAAKSLAAPPALIVLDVMLPGIDGLEVLRRLRASASTRDVPVVVLSNSAGIGGKQERARELGILDWLTKARTTPGDLAAKIGRHLG